MKRQHLAIVLTLFIAFIFLPSIFAWNSAGKDYVFGGVLSNPIDGQSYLAKMKEGWNGQWLFRLPYSPNPGQGQPIFLLYIALGVLSRLVNLPVEWAFQLSRIAAAILLFYSLYALVKKSVGKKYYLWTLLLLLFGSGMGWLILAISSNLPVDFYVAEIYPFLSSYTNPHFPLGISLMIWVIIKSLDYQNVTDAGIIFVLGLLLSSVLSFGVVIFLSCYALLWIWEWKNKNKLPLTPFFSVLAGGGSSILYQFYIIKTDPVLSLWDAQNITQAPDPFSLLVGFLPAFVVVVLGARLYLKSEPLSSYHKLLMIWIVISLVLTYTPFNLQRRFLTSLYIPVALVTIVIFEKWQINNKRKTLLFSGLLVLSVISNLLIILMGMSACSQKESPLYLSTVEYKALVWIKDHSQTEDIVLAKPELSIFIPNIAERRVVYGHPFETVHAGLQKEAVTRYYSGKMNPAETETFIQNNRIRFILFESKDNEANTALVTGQRSMIYDQDGIKIFEVK
jgi:hypothetical protein